MESAEQRMVARTSGGSSDAIGNTASDELGRPTLDATGCWL